MTSYNEDLARLINKFGKAELIKMITNFGEDEKRCPICKQTLKAEKFYVRPNGHLSGYCIECAKKYNKEHYKKQRNRY